MLRLLFILFFSVYSLAASAALDREMLESRKCSQLFSYFERKHGIPLDALYSIALAESGRPHSKHNLMLVSPWAVNVEGQGYHFDSKREAVLFVKQQMQMGKKSIDVGCMQVNLKHHPNAFRSIEHAFDPIRNISYAAEFLRSKYDQLGDWVQAIGHYHSATYALGSKYRQNVVKIANNMEDYKLKLKTYSTPHHYSNPSRSNFTSNKPARIYHSKQMYHNPNIIQRAKLVTHNGAGKVANNMLSDRKLDNQKVTQIAKRPSSANQNRRKIVANSSIR